MNDTQTIASDLPIPRAPAPNPLWPSVLYRPRRILLVDDDEGTRHLGCILLSRAGYDVDVAEDGELAWTALRRGRYDLLLTDHNMPRLCGLELVARMRAACMTLPVILNSGCTDFSEFHANPNLDLAAILQKPFVVSELLDTVACILPPNRSAVGGGPITVPQARRSIAASPAPALG